MLTRKDIERLAASAHALRPDWPVTSLTTWLQTDHGARAYQDVAVALAYIATDPNTRTPKRMNELGPWWTATASGRASQPIHFDRCPEPGHSSYPAHNCGACRTDELEPPAPAAPHTPTTTPAPWLDDIRADIAKAKEKYAHE